MKEFWNSRYSEPGFAYGKEPNLFFAEMLTNHAVKGQLLLPAEGEGRNAVYAAKQGLEVTAFDVSEAACQKAIQFAKENGVSINMTCAGFGEIQFAPESFDAIAIIFVHQPEEARQAYIKQLLPALKDGGLIILEEFSKQHLAYNAKNPGVGGPQNPVMLNSADEIRRDYATLEILHLEETETELNEGKYHIGVGHVVRFVGRKK
jgi:ubiquinone/menaquinone biosynthesis C-methylase UbiE